MAEHNNSYLFVNVTQPSSSLSSMTRQAMRITVMQNYLTRASRDPTTTDRRVVRRRPRPIAQDVEMTDVSGTTSSLAAPDSHAGPDPWLPSDPPHFDSSSLDTKRETDDCEGVLLQCITPIAAREILAHLAHRITTMPIVASRIECVKHLADHTTDLYSEALERALPFLYRYRYLPEYTELVYRVTGPTRSSAMLDLMKILWIAHYGSECAVRHWIPLVQDSLGAYWSTFIAAAPYLELVLATRFREGSSPRLDPDNLVCQTALMRLLHGCLEDPEKACSDEAIITISQLQMIQLLATEPSPVESHQTMLKELIKSRQGLEKLEEQGDVIATTLVVNEYESAILQNRPIDTLYSAWLDDLNVDAQTDGTPSPASPLFHFDLSMLNIADDSLCTTDTFSVLHTTAELIDTIFRHHARSSSLRRQDPVASPDSPSPFADPELRLQIKLRSIYRAVHAFEPLQIKPDTRPADHIYETVRLAALRLVHAASHRKPLHEHTECRRQRSDDRICADVSAEMMFQSLQNTPVDAAWGKLVGVLYWVLLVGTSMTWQPEQEARVGRKISSGGNVLLSDAEYFRLFFKVHMVRVSTLMRFEYPYGVMGALKRMTAVNEWLRGDVA